jgi:hypothetical protein
MASNDDEGGGSLPPTQSERLDVIKSAMTLSELRTVMGTDSEHNAYMEAKSEWKQLRDVQLGEPTPTEGLPGDTVVLDGQEFVVHGVTHADTDEERAFLREHVSEFLDNGETVYCEQGIRPMYFDDIEAVCEIDDYRWAMYHCRNMDGSSHIDGVIETTFEETDTGLGDDMKAIASQFRELTFSLINSGTDIYGDRFASVVGDIASDFMMDHEDIATAENFASFSKSKRAATDPNHLAELQYYYKTVFLPQPLEREWLRRHDRELELFTHARNERITDYALYHGSDSKPVHLIVGAAHQPGVVYYLEKYRDEGWNPEEFEFVP